MHIKQALAAYRTQKSNAAKRGIAFLLTFKEWCDWWGDDIDRRGVGPDKLSMQRVADTGPYALGNIRKGYPKQNAQTCGNMTRKRNSDKAAQEREQNLNAMMGARSDEAKDEIDPESDEAFFRTMGFDRRSVYGRGY